MLGCVTFRVLFYIPSIIIGRSKEKNEIRNEKKEQKKIIIIHEHYSNQIHDTKHSRFDHFNPLIPKIANLHSAMLFIVIKFLFFR